MKWISIGTHEFHNKITEFMFVLIMLFSTAPLSGFSQLSAATGKKDPPSFMTWRVNE